MQLSFLEHSIKLQIWPNKNSMLDFLSHCGAGKLLLGDNTEQEIEFYSVVVFLNHSPSDRFGVGICSQGHGLSPHLLLQPENSILLFGFNTEIVGVHIPYREIGFNFNLESLFYSFLPLYDQDMLLIQHETGIVAMTLEGQMIWKFSKDIVTNTVIKHRQVYVEFMDSSPVHLNLTDGTIIPN